jgi:hypothetical protein
VKVIADFMMPPSIAAAEGKRFCLDGAQVGHGKYDDYSLLSVSTSRTMGRSLKHPWTVIRLLKRHSSKFALQEVVDFADRKRTPRASPSRLLKKQISVCGTEIY